MKMTKAEIVKEAVKLGVDLRLTHSCYDPSPDGRACGHCDSCILRRKGFEEAGVVDPWRSREDFRDLLFDPRRRYAARRPVCVRANVRLQPPLRLVRYAIYLLVARRR